MKQSLQLRIGQSLTMTPQLQQAIRLLQLSTLELQAEIQEALDSNPMLEVEDENTSSDPLENSQKTSDEQQLNGNERDSQDGSDINVDTSTQDMDLNNNQDMPDELPVDSQWDDIYEPSVTTSNAPAARCSFQPHSPTTGKAWPRRPAARGRSRLPNTEPSATP